MLVLKNLRSSTEMKMSAATMPTNVAAVHSMTWMMRSATLRRGVVMEGSMRARASPPERVRRGATTARLPRQRARRRAPRNSHRGVVLHQALVQAVEHLLRIGAGLLGALGPLLGHRR